MFRIPGTTVQVRLFDPVETTDTQYNVYDVGVQYDDGGIDSMVVGGSFYSAKKWMGKLDDKAAKKAAKKEAKKARKARKTEQRLAAEKALAERMASETSNDTPVSEDEAVAA